MNILEALRWAARHWLSILAVTGALAVDVLDSFGLDQAADEQGARIVSSLLAPFYGGTDRVGQKAITVVLIDDTSMAELGWRAPVAYSDQANLVSLIAGFEPAAIFLDFYYNEPHGADPPREIADFANRLQMDSQGGRLPIMLGPIAPDPVFAPLSNAVRQVGVTWNGTSLLTFPFHNAEGEMAPYALYRVWCARQPDCDPNWRPGADDQLTLTWGFGASPAAAAFAAQEDRDRGCVLEDTRMLTRAAAAADRAVDATFRAVLSRPGYDSAETRCIYADTVIASQIMSGAVDAELEPLLRDRIVLIGAAHERSIDRHTIPQIGVVPGVLIHAMALDNLITERENFTRQPPPILYSLDWADAIELTLTGLLVLVAVRFRQRAAAEPTQWRAPRLPLIIGLAGATLILAMAFFMSILHWPPLNIFGVAALLGALEFVFEKNESKVVAGERKG